jgi:prepilin-type N-terminal cleavage/methylation domain-containing protein
MRALLLNRAKIGAVNLPFPIDVPAAAGNCVPNSPAARSPHASLKRRGFTVVELIVAMTILMILTAAAAPVVRVTIQRNKER